MTPYAYDQEKHRRPLRIVVDQYALADVAAVDCRLCGDQPAWCCCEGRCAPGGPEGLTLQVRSQCFRAGCGAPGDAFVRRDHSADRAGILHWQQRLAEAVHIGLYVFMIGMPLLGWFAVSAKGDPVLFFAAQLPPLIGRDKALYDILKEIHETIGTIGYYLTGLHAAVALFHHYVVRDNTLV